MRALFFGSPDFAVPCLDALAEIAEIPAVFSQPDRPAGRGLSLRKPAVKVRAEELGLTVHQPKKVRTAAFAELVESYNADVAVVVAYGRILPKRILEAPRLGCVNVHGSILPRWRGAAPIQWSIVAGDADAGVTLMQMDEGMDTGPMLHIAKTPIGKNENAGELFSRLSALGAKVLGEQLPRFVAGELPPIEQPEGATHARMLKKADGALDFAQTATELHNRIRGLYPWPGTFATLGGKRVKIHQSRLLQADGGHGAPGTVLDANDGLRIACGEGILAIDELQVPGKKRMAASAYVAGRGVPERFEAGEP